MRPLINNINKLRDNKNIQEILKEFINALKRDLESIDKEVDYELLGALFELDLNLNVKSSGFWKSISEDEIISSLPQYLQDYICKVLKSKLITSIVKYRENLEEYKNAKAFQYLIARCLIEEGIEEENKTKIEEGEKILESLMWQTENDSENHKQLAIARCNALLHLSQLLSPEEAAACVEEIHKLKVPNAMVDPLFVYQTSLASLATAKRELEENVKDAKREFRATLEDYHKTNMETLTLFVAIIAFILGVGGIVYKEECLSEKLIFLAMLSLSVVTVFAAVISMIRFKFIVVGINILTFIGSIFCGYYFLMNNNIKSSQNLNVQQLIKPLQTESEPNASVKECVN